jgi:hypothetical protein
MSFPSNEPFKPSSSIPNPYGEGSAHKPAPGFGSPYGSPTGLPEPPKKGNGCLVAGIVGTILGLFLLLCLGCGSLGYFALDADHKEIARQLSVDYRNDPKVKEQVGEVQDISYNWGATLARGEEPGEIYDVRGDKGTAQFLVEASDGEIYSVELRNDRGEWELPTEDAAMAGDQAAEHDHAPELE